MTMGRHIDDRTSERIYKAWIQGVALSDIASRFSLNETTLKRLAQRKGWPVHPACKWTRERKQ